MPYTVSRQCYTFSETPYVVEISHGGMDSCGSDAYARRYAGELETYEDPREAVEVALRIWEQWKKDKPELDIYIAHGFTAGSTLQLEPEEDQVYTDFESGKEIVEFSIEDQLKQWAEREYENLEKCARCGDVLPVPRKRFTLCAPYGDKDEEYCSERCAEQTYEYYCEEEARLQQEIDQESPNAHKEPESC